MLGGYEMTSDIGITTLNTSQVRDMFLYVGEKVIENKSYLGEIDSAIGDGDHGIGMAVGFKKAEENLNKKECSTINDVFKTIGMSMIQSMGGASGIIFGTMFMGGVKSLELYEELDLPVMAAVFESSLEAIKSRGKAEPGDKTMVDAFEPAVKELRNSADKSADLLEGLKAAEEKAGIGVENSKHHVAKFGRAKSLGERAIGHQDAGATTVFIIFKSMKEWVRDISENE